MKHIFFIQSPITYLITLSIIKFNKIDKENVVFFVKSHYKNINPELKHYYDFEGNFKNLFQPKSFLATFFNDKKQYEKVDDLVLHYTKGENFIIYIPNIFTYERQALVNHPKCIQVNFIEEGLMAYSYSNTFKATFLKNLKGVKKITALYSRVLFSWGLRRQFAPKDFFDISVIKKNEPTYYYGLSNLSFKKYTKKNVITLSVPHQISNHTLPPNSHIIILDTLLETGIVEDKNYYSSLLKILKTIPNNFYIRFHPLQSSKVKDYLINECKKQNINFKILEDSITMEEYLINSSNLTLHGHISSLLFYAKLLNHHNAISYVDDFNNDMKFIKYKNTQDFDIKELLKEYKY